MKRKGQDALFGLLTVFVLILVFWALSPVLYITVSTYSAYGTSDRLLVNLYPTIIAVGILFSILLYLVYGRRTVQ